MILRLINVTLLFLAFSDLALGQLHEPMYSVPPSETDVVPLSDLSLGFMPRIRVVTSQMSGGMAQIAAELSSEDDKMSQSRRGVVYNYSMRAYGLVSGEIAFLLKSGATLSDLSLGQLGGARPLGPSGLFVVSARNGADFQSLIQLLRDSGSVSWFEVSVQYVNQEFQ